MTHPLGIDLLTVMGMGPVEHVALAADLGCRAVSLALVQPAFNPHRYPAWSLREDAGLRRELKAATRDRGVVISIGEGLNVSAELDAGERAADMDLFAELGAQRVNAADLGAERGRALDQFATLCDMARARGMEFSIGFGPAATLRSLADALEAVRQIGEDKAGVLIDAMHFFRSGGTVQQVAQLDPALIGHVRLSDALRTAKGEDADAMSGRLIPGEGDLPLRAFVDALPRGQTLGLEVPLVALAEGGRPARDYVAQIVARTREVLA